MMNKLTNTPKKTSVLDKLISTINPIELKRTRERMLIAARIDQLLHDRKWSKQEFAQRMGKEPSTISKWLSGTHNFTTDTLSDISSCLDVKIYKLLEERPTTLVYKSTFEVASHIGMAGISSMYYGGDQGANLDFGNGVERESWISGLPSMNNLGQLNTENTIWKVRSVVSGSLSIQTLIEQPIGRRVSQKAEKELNYAYKA